MGLRVTGGPPRPIAPGSLCMVRVRVRVRVRVTARVRVRVT